MTVKENIVEEFELHYGGGNTDYLENSESTVCIVPKDTESIIHCDISSQKKVDTVVRCNDDSIDFDLVVFTGIDDNNEHVWTCIKEEYWNRLLKCVEGKTERLNFTLNTESWRPVIVAEIEDCDYKVVIAPVSLKLNFDNPLNLNEELNEEPDTINEVIFE